MAQFVWLFGLAAEPGDEQPAASRAATEEAVAQLAPLLALLLVLPLLELDELQPTVSSRLPVTAAAAAMACLARNFPPKPQPP